MCTNDYDHFTFTSLFTFSLDYKLFDNKIILSLHFITYCFPKYHCLCPTKT